MIKAGTWVQIHKIILTPNERAPHLPADTKLVPLEIWIKGTLLKDSKIGKPAEIKTVTGRIETGTLVQANPHYSHSFGNDVPELHIVRDMVKTLLWGEQND